MIKLNPEQEQALSERLRHSYENLVYFRYFLLTNGKGELEAPEYHYDWSDILLNDKRNFAVEGFRESGKGQLVLRAFPLYCLRFPSDERDYIVLIKQNTDVASQKLIEIENEYLSNPVLSSNLVNVKQKSARIFSVDVKDAQGNIINVRIEAYGKGSSIRGLANIDRRPRIVIVDDPQSIDDSKSDTMLENDWLWFLSDVKFLGQITRIFLIGNNLGEKCIIERVMQSSGELGFETRKVSITNDNGDAAWPQKFPVDMIKHEEESYRRLGQIDVWMRERMCQATSAETRAFNLYDIQRYSYLYVDNIIKDCNIFMTVDPASSVNKSACFRAICVNAVSADNRWTIVDFPYGRWPSDVFIGELFKAVVKWSPYCGYGKRVPVGIEKGHFKQILEPFIYREMQRRNIFFDIKPIEHIAVGTKLERVKMLAPRFKAHSVYLPETAPWLAELETELMGVTIDGFKSLYTDLCFVSGTKIATLFGNKNIEDITVKDLIITPFGVRKVKACGLTGNRETISKFGIEATSNHKVFCYEKGFASIDSLCYTSHISRYNAKEVLKWRYQKLLYSMSAGIKSTGRESIIAVAGIMTEDTIGMDFIKRCGNFITKGKFLKAALFTTLTVMSIITTYLTLSVYLLSNIIKFLKILIIFLLGNTWQGLGLLLFSGINLRKAINGINNTLLIFRRIKNRVLENVIYVARAINISTLPQNIVLQGVYNVQSQIVADNTRKESVPYVAKNLNVEDICLLKPAQEFAQPNMAGNARLSVKEDNLKPVYNLTVEKDAVYYANGVLVSNCDSLAMQQQIAVPPVKRNRPGARGFQDEIASDDYDPLTGKYRKEVMV